LLYDYQGKYEHVELLYKRSLEIRAAKLGKDHPDVAISLNDLACLYTHQGKFAEETLSITHALTLIT